MNFELKTLSGATLQQVVGFTTVRHLTQMGGLTSRPIIEHCISVAKILQEYTPSPDILAAAILHDITGTDTEYEELEIMFGPIVANLVEQLSPCRDDPWLDRQKRDRLNLALASEAAWLIKLADIIHSTKTLPYPGNTSKEVQESIRQYLMEAGEILIILNGQTYSPIWLRAFNSWADAVCQSLRANFYAAQRFSMWRAQITSDSVYSLPIAMSNLFTKEAWYL